MSWLATAALSGLLMLSLFGIVYRGNRIINEQQAALRRRMEEIREVSEQNRLLKEKAQRASSRISEMNESYLRHVGAELHDGPAQLIGLAALKVEHVRRAKTGEKQEQELRAMASTLAGNLTITGSVANIIVVERARAEGVHVGFREYLRIGLPVTVATLIWGSAWLWISNS